MPPAHTGLLQVQNPSLLGTGDTSLSAWSKEWHWTEGRSSALGAGLPPAASVSLDTAIHLSEPQSAHLGKKNHQNT